MLFLGLIKLYLYICCASVSAAAASALDYEQSQIKTSDDGLFWLKTSSLPANERSFGDSDAVNVLIASRMREVSDSEDTNQGQDPLANRSDASINSIEFPSDFYSPSINPLRRVDEMPNGMKIEGELDELEKAEMHTNNHQSAGSSGPNVNQQHLNHHSRLYAQHYQTAPINHHYNSKHLSSSGYGNHINLNYIHSLLAKPSAPSSLSNLLSPSSNLYGSPPSSSSYYSALALASLQNSIRDNMISQQPPMQQVKSNHDTNIKGQTSLNQSSIDFSGSSLCGRPQIGVREPRIVGGNKTFEGEFPWAVSIQKHNNHHCGGVIVGRRWVLTAAHCVRNQLVNNLLIRTGGHTLTRSPASSSSQAQTISNHLTSHLARDYLVDQIVMHDDFSRYDNLTASQLKSSANTNNADIALLRLKQEIHWNELALPVCFPSKESGNFSGHDAVVIGWGKLNEKSEDFSNELQKVKLTIIDNKLCQNWFRQAGREMPIDERIICAGFKNGGKDACHGDSGGPLLSKINGQYVIVGVVSTGIGCARPLLPGLYSRVSSYLSWIERHVTANSY